jgi:hypothetical protein
MTRPSFFDVSSTPLPFRTLPPVRESIARSPAAVTRTAQAFERLGAELRSLEAIRVARDAGRDEGYRAGREGLVWALITGAVSGAISVCAIGWLAPLAFHLVARWLA